MLTRKYSLPFKAVGWPTACLMLGSLVAGAGLMRWFAPTGNAKQSASHAGSHADAGGTTNRQQHDRSGSPDGDSNSNRSNVVPLPPELWSASAVEIGSATRGPFSQSVTLTGKISLNEDRVAHIFPMVEGAVDSVHVQLGQRVRQNDVLVVIHSREVGQAKLELYQAKLMHELAISRDQRARKFADNTKLLIGALRDGVSINEIEARFRDRPMGDYRQQLLSAYANYYKSQADFARLESLGSGGAVAAKQFVTAEASRNADRAAFQACLEQIEQDLENALLESSQAVKESETRMAVAETSLKILGYQLTDQTAVNPAEEGAAISHYPIRAPFDGTVLSKDAALLEHTRPDVQLLSIADLSTVWVTVDVYEEHLPLLASLTGKKLVVRNEAFMDRSFDATVFYTGEIMDESSRTIALRASAPNEQGLLKPGMFVSVELPGIAAQDVLQVPLAAVQEHEGEKFVFVHKGGELFERRDVRVGQSNAETIEILDGIEPSDQLALSGGFVLKSRLLASLLGGE